MTATLTVRARLEGALFAFAQSEPLGVRLALLAMLLSLPGAFMGFQLDDHVGRYVFSELPGAKHLYQLYGGGYALANGDAGDNHWQVESGYAPWWTYPQLRISFLRPLSLLTHELDAQLFPDSSLLQHAHSLLWLGLLVVIATWLYRGVLGAFVGGLAALLFALDHTRGFAVGFVMNRHALIGAALGALCLVLHQRERRGLAAIVYAAALLSSESAIAVAGYLFAYAVFLQPGKARRRLVSLVPYVAITLLWRALYNATGHGGFGSGLYVDPAREPIEFAVTLLRRAPIQALGQLLVPPAEVYWLYGPRLAQAVWCAGVLALVAFAAALVPLWQREPSARFWALGCALSLVPASAGYPSGRQMAFVGLGAMPLLAQLWHLHAVTLRDAPRAEGGRGWLPLSAAVGALVLGVHLGISPLASPIASCGVALSSPLSRAADDLGADIAGKDLVLLSSPDYFAMRLAQLRKRVEGAPLPHRWRGLAFGSTPVTVTRTGERTLVLEYEGGILQEEALQLYRDRRLPMRVGEHVQLEGLDIEVLAVTRDGRPERAQFRFDAPLEAPSFRFYTWRDNGYVAFAPPRIGGRVQLPKAQLHLALPL